jgi:hypothetical protein
LIFISLPFIFPTDQNGNFRAIKEDSVKANFLKRGFLTLALFIGMMGFSFSIRAIKQLFSSEGPNEFNR